MIKKRYALKLAEYYGEITIAGRDKITEEEKEVKINNSYERESFQKNININKILQASLQFFILIQKAQFGGVLS